MRYKGIRKVKLTLNLPEIREDFIEYGLDSFKSINNDINPQNEINERLNSSEAKIE